MGLEQIIKILEEEAGKEQEEILSRAKERANKLLEQARAEAKQIEDREIERVTSALKGEQAKTINIAKLYVKKETVRTKEELIEKAFLQAAEQLKEFRKSKDYLLVFRKLLKEVVANTEGKILVSADKRDSKLAQETLEEMGVDYKLEPTLRSLGGAKVTTSDGRITLVNTLDSRLEKARQILKPEVTKTLFG